MPEALPPRAEQPLPWHTWSAEVAARLLGTDLGIGLPPAQQTQQARRHGRNEIPDIPRRPRAAILSDQVASVPILMLAAAAGISLVMSAPADALFIGGAILANAAIGYFTEDYAERTIQSLRQARTPHARVLREGRRTKIDVGDVVPGDILVLEPGHVVAADGRVLRSDGLQMDESLLTGESAARAKDTEALVDPRTPLPDRTNMVYAGSAVASGRGAAIVTATGLATELGHVRTLIHGAPETPPPMTRALRRMGAALAVVSIGICAVYAAAGLLLGLPTLEVLAVAASLAVSAIPEGLPTVATTAMAMGMRRMRAQNVVIRRLAAVAALGSGTVLCVDKTGTLTENRLKVRTFVLDGVETEVSGTLTRDGIRFLRDGEPISLQDDPLLLTALQVGALCTRAELRPTEGEELDATGSATEQALLLTAAAAGVDVRQLAAALPLGHLGERAAGRNYMVSVHPRWDGGREAFVKGAPEEVLALCSRVGRPGGSDKLTSLLRRRALARNGKLAADGLRVLGLAHATLEAGETCSRVLEHLAWVGLVGMDDPVRGGAREAVEQLAAAGIGTLMLTGDQRLTAETVGRTVGLGNGSIRVEDAAAIERCLDRGERLPDVLARVTPEDKYRIVRLLQERGHVVMMTGDGINDAPALKVADVGIAMGARSTQIARDLADVILLDDNLASVPVAVGHGRSLYANIRKAMRFLLASNLADILLVGASLTLRLSLPLTAFQLLWMNLVSDVFPALALSMEPAEPDVMRRPPRPPREPLIGRSIGNLIGRDAAFMAAAVLAAYLWALGRYGLGARARTVAFTTISMAEILYALACRTERPLARAALQGQNRYLAGCIGISSCLQVAAVKLPWLRRVLGTVPLSGADWLVVAAGAGGVLAAAEGAKRLPSATAR